MSSPAVAPVPSPSAGSSSSSPSPSPAPSPSYAVFRKRFYVPTQWRQNADIKQLIEFRYTTTSNLSEHFAFIKKRLESLNYHQGDLMLHDYILEYVCDLLCAYNIPYITERDLRDTSISAPCLREYLNNLTPDIIMKGKMIVDVYVGKQDADDKKKKYKIFDHEFKIISITVYDIHQKMERIYTEHLKSLQDTAEIERFDKNKKNWIRDVQDLYKNFQLMHTEHQYWMSCLKLQKILRNEIDNIDVPEPKVDVAKVQENKVKFLSSLEEYATQILKTRKFNV